MIHPSSFRDPAGFVFTRDGVLYRQITDQGRAHYDLLMSSGLYRTLVQDGDLIAHQEVDVALAMAPGACKVIRPERVPFVSYPYEWSFGQLKDAALLTLRLQKAAMRHGLSLRDATAFNVMFVGGRPVWIDTLSFEALRPGTPWIAYRQFCESFLAPLALMSRTDPRAHQLLRSFLDGIPLPMASSMLPLRTWTHPGLLMHVHLHATAHRRLSHADHNVSAVASAKAEGPRRDREGAPDSRSTRSNPNALAALIDSLERAVMRLDWSPSGTTWGDYYQRTNYTDAAFAMKRQLVSDAIARLQPTLVWDLGANDGTFSRLASDAGINTVAFDVDPAAVEHNYRTVKRRGERTLLPLLMDLTNPTAAIGWANTERMSLPDRGPADVALALALVHHLAIAHNVPLSRIAAFFASLTRALVVEFVPKEDSHVQRMLASREDIFSTYHRDGFEAAFHEHFTIESSSAIDDSVRTLYVMRRR